MAARVDLVTDPQITAGLLLARRGQAYFSRKLNELSDAEFTGPSLLPNWSRAHLTAHVGYNARAISRLVNWAASGVEKRMYQSSDQRNREIELGSTLPAIALRNLSDHAAIHLNVEWRDLPDDRWNREVITAQGRTVPVLETVWMRSREVWIHAVDLDIGGRFADFPDEFIDLLLIDIFGKWRSRGDVQNVSLVPTDRARGLVLHEDADPGLVVRGTAASLAAWAAGRGSAGVVTSDGAVPPPAPHWL